ncbi:hypothetical protein AA313_de0204148 [Arthrobotrys entomopaga]|nr:hypothetical protein AA313_de0204148 [Arthrobotrys entomopaga]
MSQIESMEPFGPPNFGIGLKSAIDPWMKCHIYGINKDVLMATCPRIEAEIIRLETDLKKEITEYYLDLPESKTHLLKSAVYFLNYGKIGLSLEISAPLHDKYLFLFSFGEVIGCSVLKDGIVREMVRDMVMIQKSVAEAIMSKNTDSDMMDWISCFYECSNEKEVLEYKLWQIVEKAYGGYLGVEKRLRGLPLDDGWDEKLRNQIKDKLEAMESDRLLITEWAEEEAEREIKRMLEEYDE